MKDMEEKRSATTERLSCLAERLINPKCDSRIYWAREVTFDHGTDHAVRVDYMHFKPVNNRVSGIEKGDFYCYEVKSCKEDFHSGHGLNFIGDFNYLVMPFALYLEIQREIPRGIGVYCPTESGNSLYSVQKATRRSRDRPVVEMLLMMFRSAARDRQKAERESRCLKAGISVL